MSDSLRPHESQHARPPCPSPTPGIYSNSCPSSPWCHPAISSSIVLFSSCLQSLPASGSFLMSQLFAWGGQSIRVSTLASVLPMNTQDRFPLGWTGWIFSLSKALKSPPQHHSSKASILRCSAFFIVQLSHPYSSVKFSSVTKSCPTLWHPMNHSMPGLPVHHQLPESTQTHVHFVGDAIQPSHPLSSPSPPALNLSQRQGLFKWVSFSYEVAKVLEFQLQHQSLQWTRIMVAQRVKNMPCNAV